MARPLVVPLDVVVVGQTPPPHHGQAIMIQRLLDGHYEQLRLHHVRMEFSRTIGEVGKLGLRKAVHVAQIIHRIARVRAATGASILYYPPGGIHRAPLYRDGAILGTVRPWFRQTIYHFHAGGLEQSFQRLTRPERRVLHLAYDRPQCAILLSEMSPPDGDFVSAQTQRIIPYGIEDVASQYTTTERRRPEGQGAPTILCVGMLSESKGVLTTLGACAQLHARRIPHRLRLVGAFDSQHFERTARDFVATHGLGRVVEFPGVLTGADKWREYASADIFCFPTHYEMEAFPVVALEAAQFALPVVASSWRGLPSIVRDGESGIIVPPNDATACAQALERLIADSEFRLRMGSNGRARFVREFTIGRWRQRMEEVFVEVGTR